MSNLSNISVFEGSSTSTLAKFGSAWMLLQFSGWDVRSMECILSDFMGYVGTDLSFMSLRTSGGILPNSMGYVMSECWFKQIMFLVTWLCFVSHEYACVMCHSILLNTYLMAQSIATQYSHQATMQPKLIHSQLALITDSGISLTYGHGNNLNHHSFCQNEYY